jgi:hypothetical protein
MSRYPPIAQDAQTPEQQRVEAGAREILARVPDHVQLTGPSGALLGPYSSLPFVFLNLHILKAPIILILKFVQIHPRPHNPLDEPRHRNRQPNPASAQKRKNSPPSPHAPNTTRLTFSTRIPKSPSKPACRAPRLTTRSRAARLRD